MDEVDYLVLGGGSAGSVLASRLSEDPSATVALIEAGGSGDGWMIDTPIANVLTAPTKLNNWAYETVPQPGLGGRRGYQPRGRALGGSSAINAMIYTRGHPADYDRWAALGNPGWSYAETLTYFRKAENNEAIDDAFHGRGGPLNVANSRSDNPFQQRFLAAAREAQFPLNDDFNGARQEGLGLYQVTQINGERCSAARAYLRPHLGKRPNLRVETHARALRLLFDGKRAIGAEILQRGVKRTLRARRETIVSLGAFGSPQLLMLSGVGEASALRALGIAPLIDLPGVGANLHDHPDVVLGYASSSRDLVGLSFGALAPLLAAIARYRRERRGMATTNFAEAGGFLRTRPDLAQPDIQLHFVIAVVEDHARNLRWGRGMTCHVCALKPKSRGSLKLAGLDPLAAPLIDPAFLAEPEDVETLVAGFKLTQRLMHAPSLSAHWTRELFGGDEANSDDEIRAFLRRRVDTVYHPVGTCAMGPDPKTAVVDARLRVHGLEALRVVDASIMPEVVAGNTNAPVIMIAEKAAEMMRGDYERASRAL
jgi:choline dehydrogenase-like flavoprotein